MALKEEQTSSSEEEESGGEGEENSDRERFEGGEGWRKDRFGEGMAGGGKGWIKEGLEAGKLEKGWVR